jgi:hypothetical protein
MGMWYCPYPLPFPIPWGWVSGRRFIMLYGKEPAASPVKVVPVTEALAQALYALVRKGTRSFWSLGQEVGINERT